MNKLKKMFEKKVDERQEIELMKVERTGFWVMYWMLLATLFIEGIIMEKGELLVGEFVVFMTGCLVIVIGCLRKGLWTYQSKQVPGAKAWLRYSLITAVVAGIPLGIFNAVKWCETVPEILLSVVIMVISLFILCFVAFAIVGTIAKKENKSWQIWHVKKRNKYDSGNCCHVYDRAESLNRGFCLRFRA